MSPKPALRVQLEFDKRKYKSVDPQHLVFSLTNDTAKPMSVLRWYTPFEDFKSNMFDVRILGHRTAYVGRTYKRGMPTEKDFLIVEPGETVTKQVNFTEAYDVAHAGQYEVQYKTEMLYAGAQEPGRMVRAFGAMPKAAAFAVEAKPVSFTLEEGRQPKQVAGLRPEVMAKLRFATSNIPVFENCDADQEKMIKEALAEAVQMAKNASQSLANTPVAGRPAAQRYKEWFGKYTTAYYSTVASHFDKIFYVLVNKPLTFIGDWGDQNSYAWVYPDRPYEIHLCGAFLGAPLAGSDSKAGTIVHETSHFYVVASTDDYVYGQTLCRNLAKTPAKATDNADSHEFFAENTPTLPM